ncbi:MAG: hypothetical protein ABF932_04700 [Gluconobacter potus]|uniref:Uncharacterized protein n=1 Tax=Gluconobacter potus TaxID=2724927 RepID=A0ABR9YJ03_9PROT|nr:MULTISPECIES: hypothetical protein [Gluconobacter]MBF0863474.1 hypothetical protein [Gluconobacter sp. R71656]MBF0866281.1 hypothetical protein [Gluconobacter sp. R75628]MBF0872591.1 hypothetical protein [Gluconobacter sp. R75629]MBF0881557.1 hypothetical protein [Gluconobacter potus]
MLIARAHPLAAVAARFNVRNELLRNEIVNRSSPQIRNDLRSFFDNGCLTSAARIASWVKQTGREAEYAIDGRMIALATCLATSLGLPPISVATVLIEIYQAAYVSFDQAAEIQHTNTEAVFRYCFPQVQYQSGTITVYRGSYGSIETASKGLSMRQENAVFWSDRISHAALYAAHRANGFSKHGNEQVKPIILKGTFSRSRCYPIDLSDGTASQVICFGAVEIKDIEMTAEAVGRLAEFELSQATDGRLEVLKGDLLEILTWARQQNIKHALKG